MRIVSLFFLAGLASATLTLSLTAQSDSARSDSAFRALQSRGAVQIGVDMAARPDRIRYQFRELPRGGEVRIISNDAVALAAIHDFLAFQRQDHRTDHAGHRM